ncbi:hypothetical protein JK359_17670 [Streptomyces actinomycinicus]|uniref:Uncharacterized protein n=1 Tax=Streptomyces actinomycinicus TaxID=1695166 RepID=A0A937EKS9_9ACTN|nr:hypothetical protein [Streptomyces actinomycinicus]MBL1083774.1 hypothetical protein [Streptomyces actinomycinicus]
MEHAEVDRLAALLRELVAGSYVFPGLGERFAAGFDRTARSGRYTVAENPAALAKLVTEDLSGDGHRRRQQPPGVRRKTGWCRAEAAGSVWAAVREREEVRPMKAVSVWVLPLFVTVGD